MFSSVSACIPDSQVSVTFQSASIQTLDISADIEITVNGVIAADRPIELIDGDQVSANILTPAGYLEHVFYPYTLDSVTQYFAIVNCNRYTPTVTVNATTKKWFNYEPSNLVISFRSNSLTQQVTLGFGKGLIDMNNIHIILNPLANAVFFYSAHNELISRVTLPAGPIEYRKIARVIPGTSIVTHEVIVLCNNKRLYRIRFDNLYYDSDEFRPVVIPVSALPNLYFQQDLPNGKTFIDAAMSKWNSALFPVVAAFDVSSDNIWVAGANTLFRLTKEFSLVSQMTIDNEQIVGVAYIGNDAVVTTKNNSAYYVFNSGSSVLIYQSTALGSPISHAGIVYLPDSDNQQLVLINNSSGSYQTISTVDFLPAYARSFDGSLWVTGHDTTQVLKYTNDQLIERHVFDDKVTLVSAVGSSIIAVHYLKDFTTLNLTGIKKVIPFSIPALRGPISHIGSSPVLIKMLGAEAINPVACPGLTCWINGIENESSSTGDYLGISYKAMQAGNFRTVFVFGDQAFDVDITVVAAVYPLNYEPRNLIPIRVSADSSTEAKFEIIVDHEIPLDSDILLSLSYGHLYLNNAAYTGTYSPKKDDIITITVPFNTSKRLIATMLSLGEFQIAIPAVPDNVMSSLTEWTYLLTDQPKGQLITSSVTVMTTGSYMIPDYYHPVTGVDIALTITRAGVTTNVLTRYPVFRDSDIVAISNQLTSNRLYDMREVVIIGPDVLRSQLRTASNAVFNTSIFGSLIQPFVRYEDYSVSISNVVTASDSYTSVNVVLASGSAITSTLYSDVPGVAFTINGTTLTNTAVGVQTGDTVSLEWTVQSYFETNVTVYQVQTDVLDSSNVYVPIGYWGVENQVISDPIADETSAIAVNILSAMDNAHDYISNSLQTTYFSNDKSEMNGDIEVQYLPNEDAGNVNSSIMSVTEQVSNGIIGQIDSLYNSGTDEQLTSSVSTQYQPNDSKEIIDTIDSLYVPNNTDEFTSGVYTQYQPNNTDEFTSGVYTQYHPNNSKEIIDTVDSLYVPNNTDEFTSGVYTQYHPNNSKEIIDIITLQYDSNDSPEIIDIIPSYYESNDNAEIIDIISSLYRPNTDDEVAAATSPLYRPNTDDEVAAATSLLYRPNTDDEVAAVMPLLLTSINGTEMAGSAPSLYSPNNEDEVAAVMPPLLISINGTEMAAVHEPQYNTPTSDELAVLTPTIYRPNNDDEVTAMMSPIHHAINEIAAVHEPQYNTPTNDELAVLTPTIYRPNNDDEVTVVMDPLFMSNDSSDTIYNIGEEYVANNIIDLSSMMGTIIDDSDLGEVIIQLLPEQEASIASEVFGPLVPEQEASIAGAVFGELVPDLYSTDIRSPDSMPMWILDKDVIWGTDLLMERGTFNTYIKIYANNDLRGALQDQPFILYEKDYIFSPGSYRTEEDATSMAIKYESAAAIQIVGTDYWNYRIFLNTQQYCTPRKGKVFPVIWYVRGG